MWEYIVFFILALILLKIYIKFTTGHCLCQSSMNDKTIIVTGSNTGIGFETAKDLARRGGRVILACRDERKALAALDKIVKETGNKNVIYRKLDLTSFDSIRKFADEILKTEERLDVLVNNAGMGDTPGTKTADGLSLVMQVNYFGPFLLTNLLLPKLKKSSSSRIVHVSSMFHHYSYTNLSKINDIQIGLEEYIMSKLCVILFSNEISRRYHNVGVISNSLHPGAVNTDIYRNIPIQFIVDFISFVMKTLFKSPLEGAQTSIHLAVMSDTSISGEYFSDCKIAQMSSKARDEGLAKKVWELSEKYVKLHTS